MEKIIVEKEELSWKEIRWCNLGNLNFQLQAKEAEQQPVNYSFLCYSLLTKCTEKRWSPESHAGKASTSPFGLPAPHTHQSSVAPSDIPLVTAFATVLQSSTAGTQCGSFLPPHTVPSWSVPHLLLHFRQVLPLSVRPSLTTLSKITILLPSIVLHFSS